MTWTNAKTPPTEPGWYVVRLRCSDRPLVLWWSRLSTQWRAGCQVQRVAAWMGPLP